MQAPEKQGGVTRILTPLAAAFKLGIAVRHAAYRRGWLKARSLARPVVSVGNLTVGGTGKTPFVAYLAGRLLNRGIKPSILTRGYGRRIRLEPIAIAPGSGPAARDPRDVGDEPALLARQLPDVPIVISADRYLGGCLAEERFDVDVHLLDDGFQHIGLARAVDIVLLDATQELHDDALLPAGPLREPLSALERAHLVVLTRVELADPRALEVRVRQINPRAEVFQGRTRLCDLKDLMTGKLHPVDAFQRDPLYAFCGIGNPRAFFANLKGWGFSLVGETTFRDHHTYTASNLGRLAARARSRGARTLITTEKDSANFPLEWKSELTVVTCVIQTEVAETDAFDGAVLARLGARKVRV